MSILLWFTVAIAFAVVAWGYRQSILVVAASVGFLAYSVPALVGVDITVSIGSQRSIVTATSPESVGAMNLGWLGYIAALMAFAVYRRSSPAHSAPSPDQAGSPAARHRLRTFALSAMLISGLIFAFMAVSHGLLFFLNSRAFLSQVLGYDYLLWRWVNVFGLLFAILSRSRIPLVFFAAMTFVNMVIGDRTVITIALVSAFCINYRSTGAWTLVKRPSSWAYALALVAVVFFAKAFYVSLKDGLSLANSVSIGMDQWVISFEPFGTHFILDRVIAYDIHTSLASVIRGSLGQLLIVPSFFGIESSSFNAEITQQLYNSRLSYGIASNIWAQGYTLGGYAGVLIFGAGFGAFVVWCQRMSDRAGPLASVLVTLIAIVAGVYIHRNSVENYLSFVRQLILAFLIIGAVAQPLLWMRPQVAAPIKT